MKSGHIDGGLWCTANWPEVVGSSSDGSEDCVALASFEFNMLFSGQWFSVAYTMGYFGSKNTT